MKVLLVADVEKLGWLGDVVEVAAGYARNYLLAQGLAVVPTEANLRAIAKEKAGHAEQRKKQRERLEAVAAAVQGAEAVVAAKANEQGHLFGSVGPQQIAENLREQGFEIADEMVRLSGSIKQLGAHQAVIHFADDLTSDINVVVVAAGQTSEGSVEPEVSAGEMSQIEATAEQTSEMADQGGDADGSTDQEI